MRAGSAGRAELQVSGRLAETEVETKVEVEVKRAGAVKLIVSADTTIMSPEAEGAQIRIQAETNTGSTVEIAAESAEYESGDTSVVTVSASGYVKPVSVGEATVTVRASYEGVHMQGELRFKVSEGKTESTYYTPEKVAAARKNVETYEWARSQKNTAVKNAERFLSLQDFLYDHITDARAPARVLMSDTALILKAVYCPYCGIDVQEKYGKMAWIIDPLAAPWKIRCPDCRRQFPSNDFESFYKLGINEQGNWNYELAKQKNAELVAGGQKGYLANILYPEMEGEKNLNGEPIQNWGVDDGWGFGTGYFMDMTHPYGYPIQVERGYAFIAYYNHWGVWYDYGNIAKRRSYSGGGQ